MFFLILPALLSDNTAQEFFKKWSFRIYCFLSFWAGFFTFLLLHLLGVIHVPLIQLKKVTCTYTIEQQIQNSKPRNTVNKNKENIHKQERCRNPNEAQQKGI